MQTISGTYNIIDELSKSKRKEDKIACRFLEDLAFDFVRKAARYISFCEEASFFYREKQLDSLIAPSLYELTDAFLNELPTKRNWKDKTPMHGWVDYWCSYKNIDLFIEVKHSFWSYSSKTVSIETKNSWIKAINQLKAINKADHLRNAEDINRLISLQIIPIYQASNSKKALDYSSYDDEILKSIQETTVNGFDKKHKVNWSFLWKLSEELFNNSKYNEDGTSRVCPAVLFIAKVF